MTEATQAANSLIFDMAQKFRDRGLPVEVSRDILDRAQELQSKLIESGETAPTVRWNEAAALDELAQTLLKQGDTQAALVAAKSSRSIFRG